MVSKLKITRGKARAITPEEALYNMIDKKGETLDGTLHIIDTGDGGEHYEQSYRVYHSAGYCFDIYKEDATDEEDKKTRYYYGFYSEWPEFATLTITDALRLFKDEMNLK